MDNAVPLEAIPTWGTTFLSEDGEPCVDDEASHAEGEGRSPFPVAREFNDKIKLWSGIPWKIAVDAVVNSTSETFESCEVFRGETIHSAAGPNLVKACRQIKSCRTSQACATDAFDIPVVKKIIHTVGPRYAAKYHTAAENALCHCIWSSLEVLVEEGLRTIALGCIYTHAKGFPRETGAHITCRTIRRYLEKHGSTVDVIVLCIPEANDLDYYEQVLPLYFPRTRQEERKVISQIPANIGNERGESLMSHRDIRISETPAAGGGKIDETAGGMPNFPRAARPPADNSAAGERAKSEIVGWSSDFTSMTDSPDSRRGTNSEGMTWKFTDMFSSFFGSLSSMTITSTKQEQGAAGDASEGQSYHEQVLRRALGHKTDDIHMMRIVSKSLDFDGDPVLVITGSTSWSRPSTRSDSCSTSSRSSRTFARARTASCCSTRTRARATGPDSPSSARSTMPLGTTTGRTSRPSTCSMPPSASGAPRSSCRSPSPACGENCSTSRASMICTP